jgi:uncharacterized protein with HEPN domain
MRKDKQIESKKRLEHILHAIASIEEYAKNQTEKSFCNTSMLNNAVLFQFSVIGEAIIHVEEEKLKMHDYPWYKVRSFRNLITHEYFNIKLEAVWGIIKKELPPLKRAINEILRNEFK